MTPSRMMSVHRMRWIVAAMQVQVALLRPRLLLRAFNPAQARIPAGRPEGGRWTDEDGGSSNAGQDDGLVVRVSDEGDRRYSVVLAEEEARGGHTLREHVGKSDDQMLERVRASRTVSTFYTYGRKRVGSFDSIESANDFVNRTLELHPVEVDRVASGKENTIFIKHRFGYSTGREAYTSGYSEPYMRKTYGVGIFIHHDPSSGRGYRVHTAYPRNDGD